MPLVGSLTGQLRAIGVDESSQVIAAVTGICYQSPGAHDLPTLLGSGLSALGVKASIADHPQPNRLQRALVRRQIRRELQARRPVTAFGAGETPFGDTYGLLVGCDDERNAWRRDGPMTEQITPWLSEAEFHAAERLTVISAERVGDGHRDDVLRSALTAFERVGARVRSDLQDRIDLFNSSVEIEPQLHAHEVQTLAANWGEAASFWREHRHPNAPLAAQQVALTLSRYATLFPYPMGGQPNHPGVRMAATRILEEAARQLS